MKLETNQRGPNRAPLPVGTTLGYRYRIEQALDSGSLAEVYRATDLDTRRSVAIKLLTVAADRVLSRRLQRELKALQKLVHSNVAEVYGIGSTEDGRTFVAMEYLDGETLRRYMRRHRILDADAMLPFALQIAEGLAAAHAAGVLHRDLKPENIFVMPSGLLKIADFGTARLMAEVHVEHGMGIGTPAYMAPERLIETSSQLSEDPRSDLYSLGIIEYEMLAGYNPILGDQKGLSRAEVSWRQAAVPPRVPVGVPLEVWSVLEPTLRKEPDRRPANAREHALQLEKLVSRLGGQESAVPPPWAFTPARTPTELFVQRAVRSLLTGAGIGAVGGALVFIGWWLGINQARSSKSLETPEPTWIAPAPARSEASSRERSRP